MVIAMSGMVYGQVWSPDSTIKASFMKTVKEPECEKRAREIMEQVYDEFTKDADVACSYELPVWTWFMHAIST